MQRPSLKVVTLDQSHFLFLSFLARTYHLMNPVSPFKQTVHLPGDKD